VKEKITLFRVKIMEYSVDSSFLQRPAQVIVRCKNVDVPDTMTDN
jgi:hypothetical protein